MKPAYVYNSAALLLVLVTIGSVAGPRLLGNGTYDIDNSFAPFRKVIVTDGQTYELGETVTARLVVVNDSDQPIYINPIHEYELSGKSVHDKNRLVSVVDVRYAVESPWEVNARSNRTMLSQEFRPQYPGRYTIEWLNARKTVEVTGYKEVSLNSSGISLKITPDQTEFRDRDFVMFNLSIVNDNPYPVKVPTLSPIEWGNFLDGSRYGVYMDWVWSHWKIEANSQRVIMSKGYTVRSPITTFYYYIDGNTVSFEMEVTPR